MRRKRCFSSLTGGRSCSMMGWIAHVEAVVLKKLFGRQEREPAQVVLYSQPT